mgnify:CR=1 FL=1
MTARVSVAIATYNGEKYLSEQLDSILIQTHTVDEVIVVDDCSSDDTQAILSQYVSSYPQIKVVQNQSNLGVVKTFEKALLYCTNEFILLCDQDDVWLENKVEVLLNSIGNNLLIHSDAQLVDGNLQLIAISLSAKNKDVTRSSFVELLLTNQVTGCTVMIRKELLKFALPMPDDTYMHDYHLTLVAAYFKRIGYVNHALTKYRQHGKNVVGTIAPDYFSWKEKQRVENIESLMNMPLFVNNLDVKYAIQYRHSIYFNKFPRVGLICWVFRNFGVKRLIGFIFRASLGDRVGSWFFMLRKNKLKLEQSVSQL